jgi:hypothetical protein
LYFSRLLPANALTYSQPSQPAKSCFIGDASAMARLSRLLSPGLANPHIDTLFAAR